ncbi:ATP-binding cassette domain-containing protein [Mesomycoplasma ovipneumoniae]|uniref:ATP-binding cassette domain-containing protein n=1 Tax=Mesomycoplasma ovipneumoniae TaxID=29562 RepID=UPI0026E33167|nr:ATP-binding cassette domain-containing protein [Mesomycoplasma ovipneumoniae]MDO6829398.1 ATP-binding cassette domain-containing protein [Mesomycoplasma ovipneumoniae]MDO6857103.1 ATP-binding cassette domain-containing protein [Mesomycoplasma ovipneumoniae]
MIKIENLTKKIDNKSIFNNLNLKIPSNKITFVIGKSGIGKSTLINLIAGFTKKDSGNISFFDENGSEIKKPLVDVVFQDFNLIESLSIKNNILIANHILNRELDDSEIQQAANSIGIETNKLDQIAKNLSGGEKQRAAFLRSLSRKSDFILLDEPTGNLDHENSIALLDLLVKASESKTILIVSHDLELANQYADQIINLENLSVNVIENNKQINVESKNKHSNMISNQVYKKPGFLQKFKVALLLVLADFKSKITSFILVLVTFFALIFSMVIFMNLHFSAKNISIETVTQSNFDTIRIAEKDIISLAPEEIDQLKKDNPKIKHTSLVYSSLDNFTFIYNGNVSLENRSIWPTDESDFFKNRFSSFSKDGNFSNRFITNPNEVVLSQKLIDELKIDNPIGKTIKIINVNPLILKQKFEDLDRFSESATIVGILDKPFDDGANFSLVHTDKLKSVYQKSKQNGKESKFDEFEFLPDDYFSLDFEKYVFSRPSTVETEETLVKPNKIHKSFYENSNQVNSINLKKGTLPKNFNEIAVSSNITDKTGKLLKITNKKNTLIFKVVGVFDPEKDDENIAIFNNNIEKYSGELLPISALIYFDHDNLYNNINDFLNKYGKLGVSRYYSTSGGPDEILNEIISSQYVLLLIIFVSIIIFGISLLIFVSLYATNLSKFKKKSIGILKSLGGKTSQIFLYHWLNLVILSAFVFVLGIIFSISFVPLIYGAISNQNSIFPDYQQISVIFIIIWLGSFTILSIIYSLISYITYKKDIVTLLK